MASPEELQHSAEQSGVETAKSAAEQLEKLSNVEKSAERKAEKAPSEAEAKVEVMKQAVSVERGSAEREKKQPAQSTAPKRYGTISKKEKDKAFKKHMDRVQAELPPASRVFSKFIHNKGVEKVSDAVGSTVARPNAVLSGAVAAFILVLGVYIIAKTFGYVLSGFETIAAFVVGWILGIVYDYLKTIVTGKTS